MSYPNLIQVPADQESKREQFIPVRQAQVQPVFIPVEQPTQVSSLDSSSEAPVEPKKKGTSEEIAHAKLLMDH